MMKLTITLLALISTSAFAISGKVSAIAGKGKVNIEIIGSSAENIKKVMRLAPASKGMSSSRILHDSVHGKQITCTTNTEGQIYTSCKLTFDSTGTASVTSLAINGKSIEGTAVSGGLGNYSNVTISGAAASSISNLLKNAQGADISCTANECKFSVDASGSINRNFAK